MTETAITARSYLTDPAYLAFLDHWIANGEPPLEFADWLGDRDLWGQSECVKWCRNRELKPRFDKEDGVYARCLPFQFTGLDRYAWDWGGEFYSHSDELPEELLFIVDANTDRAERRGRSFSTLPLALTALLDGFANWRSK
jgi:hypothetical protein